MKHEKLDLENKHLLYFLQTSSEEGMPDNRQPQWYARKKNDTLIDGKSPFR